MNIINLQNAAQQDITFEPKADTISASPIQTFIDSLRHRLSVSRQPKALKPFSPGDIKILLLENVNQSATNIFQEQGYQVESYNGALTEDCLIEKIKDVHAIGIRSKTKLTAKILEHAKKLIVIGCFCIGTNQVDIDYAASIGVAVFKSPFSNSRSVAELVIAEIITLARQIGDRSIELHTGTWNKVSSRCWEVRGKTLGIIGYGHIGSQLSVLAESLGMHVLYYDIVTIMPLGTAKQMSTLNELLNKADFVTCHVPATPETKNMLSAPQFSAMKDGAYVINASRGTVVDISSLLTVMKAEKVAGAAFDVFPSEPANNASGVYNDTLNNWTSELISLPNVILTPHIGGSTEEAQCVIGNEVAHMLSKYINEGTSVSSVNLPEISLKTLALDKENTVRILYIHKNIPGVLKTVNDILADHNIDKQFSDSRDNIAYLMIDISSVSQDEIKQLYDSLNQTNAKISVRILY
ncbi:hypothetical protein KAFR_0B01270 [Kazachstania africana CBS 2517]|uniref:2-oxoglutarate reductase n=1 Tax=Kazachstania africana (strain ATCC 22294 / BCRC 22015 / CBS 2517 / CECT 1963 / NBRC 1671 / NRRL Y-8276) TaxID=1071382 RepID=H2APX6_KAZAF|nr:hypothetical protein KAFR_0B01270 [Kazachstania africana CBS 2517]CCF56426.1 hypothetical protein KAFR_0B01270 [Kazachstania africana CBS 2517]